jgi:aryl-alcohol dehydrogenase-like predicted oxidoreductase
VAAVTASLAARRRLGWTELQVCPVALGTMQFGWTATDVEAMRILDAYADAGGNLVDTANMYGGDQSTESFAQAAPHVGVSEDVIGRWTRSRGSRDRIVLTTKVRARMWDGPDGEGLQRRHIERAVEDSLRRLRTDHVDVLYAHWPDPSADPEDWMGTFGDLVRAGKVRYAATSNFVDFADFGDCLTPVLAMADRDPRFPRLACEQVRYNLVNRDEYERRLQQIALHAELGIVTYSSLAGGFLAGTADRGGARMAHLAQYHTREGRVLLEVLGAIGRERAVPTAAVALAWTLAQPGVTATLVGADRIEQVAEAAPAASLVLTEEELTRLTELSWRASEPEFVEW